MEMVDKAARPEFPDARNDPASTRGIFVVGHARSGTTVLTDALNTSADIHCLMEPYFYRTYDYPKFGAWFNRMHQGFGNPPSKGYWLPDHGDATGREIVERLRGSHRYVGEKLAFRQRAKNYLIDKFYDFAVANFPLSPFICVVRDPLKVTSSVIDMFENSAFEEAIIHSVVQSQLETYLLILRLVSEVPHCHLLEHETIDSDTLVNLGSQLDVSLDHAFSLYTPQTRKTPHLEETERVLSDNAMVGSLREFHREMTNIAGSRGARIDMDKVKACSSLSSSGADLLSKLNRVS